MKTIQAQAAVIEAAKGLAVVPKLMQLKYPTPLSPTNQLALDNWIDFIQKDGYDVRVAIQNNELTAVAVERTTNTLQVA
jgi:hypothetical protein